MATQLLLVRLFNLSLNGDLHFLPSGIEAAICLCDFDHYSYRVHASHSKQTVLTIGSQKISSIGYTMCNDTPSRIWDA